jgi:hypothetical protein
MAIPLANLRSECEEKRRKARNTYTQFQARLPTLFRVVPLGLTRFIVPPISREFFGGTHPVITQRLECPPVEREAGGSSPPGGTTVRPDRPGSPTVGPLREG